MRKRGTKETQWELGGRMKVVALLADHAVVGRIIAYLK